MAKQAKKTTTKSKKKAELKNRRFSRIGLLVFIISFAIIGGLLLVLTKAATPPAAPSIYLSPDTKSLNVGDTFTVAVYEDSGTDSINVVQANLAYDTGQLSYVSHTDSSAFTLVAENPSGDTGSLHFARGTCGGCTALTGTQLVVSVTFKALTAGTASVNFDSGTMLVRSSDSTPEPNLSEAGGTYTIASPAPPPTGGGGGGGSGGGGGTTTPPPTGTTTTTHKTTSTSHSSPAPTASASPAPSQPAAPASSDTSTPSTALTAPPLIPASAVHLLKIGGVALIMATALSIFVWALGHMRRHLHLHLAPQHNFGAGTMTMPSPAPPSQPAMTINPLPQNTAPKPAAKTAASPTGPGKPQPGTILQPNPKK